MSKYDLAVDYWNNVSDSLMSDKTRYAEFLKFSSGIYKHSFSDAAMIYHQKPDATKVTDMRTWNKLGRVVNRGERSIVVFGEGHSCNYLFDITQTNGKKAPAIWRLDSDLANRLVTRMNEVNKTEYASLDETIASMCVESVKSILLNENVSLNYNKMTKDEKKTYNRSLLSASRYLISNRCQLNGDISLDLSLNLNALDLFKDRNEFKQFADIVHDSARNVLISLEREVIKIIKDRVQDEKIAKSLSESQEESKGITYQLPFKEGDFFDIEDVLYKIDNIDLDKETVTLIDVSSNISRTKSMDIEELVLFYTKEEQREAVIMNAINNILGETPIIENEPVEVAPEIPPIDDIETIELLIKDESGRYERNVYISDFFSSETSPEKRTEYIKSIYREDVTTISLSGNVYGIEKSDNGLSFFEGETDNRIRQSKMSWNSITSMFAELYAQEKLIDEVKEDLSDFLPEDDYTPTELVTADRRIQCETSEDAKRLLDALRQQDYTWIDGEELDSTDWGYNEENTYYALNSENKTVELGDISSLSNSKLKEYNIEKFSAVSDEFIIESSIIEPDEHKYELGFYPQPNRINVFDINSDDREPIAFISTYGYIHYFKDVPNSVKRIIDNYSKSMPPMFVFPEIRKPLQGEPMVTIPFSEIGYFPKNVTMPFSQANEVFDAAETHYIDSRNNPITADDYMGYAKTDFVIEGNINGEDFTYKGRFDIGDGQGTLSNHIREEYEYTLQMYNENPTEDPKLISDRNEVIQKYKNIIGYLNQYEVYRPDPMDRAIALIDDYCDKEFGEPADFSNMDHVGLAYTTDEYTELPIEVYADLETFRIVTEYDGKVVHEELYNDLDDMCRNGLDGISFDDLVILPDDVIRQRDLDAKQGTQILISAEINGEINYYSLTDKTVDDIMKIAKGDSPIINYSNICKRINEVEYAEIQQSEDFTFSVELNFDNNSAVIYSVNNGRGGIPESDRNESNSRIEHISISDYMLEQRISDRTIAEFRSKTAQNFHSINGMNADDIEHDVKAYVEETLSESGIDAQVGEAVVYGSRSRGLEKDGSDIDVVIEIDSVLKEDALFNALNGEEYSIGGIKVDINPIRKEETGSLSSYLTEAERYLDELSKSRTAKPVYTGLGAERIDVSAEYAASMWENGFEVYVDGEAVEPHTPDSSMELFRQDRAFSAQFGDVKKQQMIDFISNEIEELDMTMPEDKYIFVRDFIDEEEDDPFKWDDGQNVYLNITKALMERKFDFIDDYLTSVKNDYDSIRAERAQDVLFEYKHYSPPSVEYTTVIDIPEYNFYVDLKNIDELYLKNDYSYYEGGIDSDGHERKDNYSRQTESLTITLDPLGTAVVERYDSKSEYNIVQTEYDLSDEVDVSELRDKVSNFIESSDELSITSKKEEVSTDIQIHEQLELTNREKYFLEKDLAPDLVDHCLAYDEVEDMSYILFENKQHEAYKHGSFGHALSGEFAVELGQRLRNGEDISAELGKAILGKVTNSRFHPTESRWVTEDVKLRHDLDTVTVIYGDLQHDVPYSSVGAEVIKRAREEYLDIEVYRATEDGILPDTRFTTLTQNQRMFYDLHQYVPQPDVTPWGEINSIHEINNGIFDVDTPSHGGIMVRNDIADRILTKEARDIAFREGGYTCFEEDVAAAVAFRELIDKDLFRNIDEYFRSNYSTPWDEKKESFNDSIDRTIREYYSEYWTKRAEAIIKSVSEEKQAELSGQLMFSNGPDTANTLSEENTITAQLVYNTPYKGIVTFVGTDNKTYVGKAENIIKSNQINGDEYDNSDNSLIYISDNQKIHRLLSIPESGSNITQQEAIDRNIYTLEDYREFTNLQETVLSQYEQSYPILFADKPFEPIHDNSILVKKDRGTAQNYHFNEDDIVHGGAKTKYKANVEAIKILNKLEKENRYATPEEQSVLAGYSGWGGIPQAFDAQNSSWSSEYSELKELLSTKEYNAARASSLTSFYTPPEVTDAVYQALSQFGYEGGNVLEPSMGIGNFFAKMPEQMSENSNLFGVELDDVSGRIAKKLYPNANIQIKGFEKTAYEDNSFDVVIGNIPFDQISVADKDYDRYNFKIHDYFACKSIDKVKPNGIMAIVASKYVMDKNGEKAREYIAQRADLLGAVRLPAGTFKDADNVTTDILFFKKKELHSVELPEWVHMGETPDGIPCNSYFVDNPDMVLGKMAWDERMKGKYGEDSKVTTCVPNGQDLKQQLTDAISKIKGQINTARIKDITSDNTETISADPSVRNYTYTLVNGELYYRQNESMIKDDVKGVKRDRIIGLHAIRVAAYDVINAQVNNCSDAELEELQNKLNKAYDKFVEKFGYISDRKNALAFRKDDDYNTLLAFEKVNKETGEIEKTEIFTKRTITAEEEITSVDSPEEALQVSMDRKGRVDIGYMSALSQIPPEKIISDLEGKIFRNPEKVRDDDPYSGYEEKSEYLSGNVRIKLDIAKMFTDKIDPSYQVNVEALTEIIPPNIEAENIGIEISTNWIDIEDYSKFLNEFVKADMQSHSLRRDRMGEYKISNKNSSNSVYTTTTYGTSRMNAYHIFENLLNKRDIIVRDKVISPDGAEKYVVNNKETQLAREKARILKEEFPKWFWGDIERRKKYVEKYNRLFNSLRGREYDGSKQTFVGMNPAIELRPHQKNAVLRGKLGGNTLLAHCVGAGKSFEIDAIVMEKKRLGLIKKACVVVPKHLTLQTAYEWQRLYPNAKLLVATPQDFTPQKKQQFAARCVTGDYDGIIMSYEQFSGLPMSFEYREKFINDQIENITSALEEANLNNSERTTVKELERIKKNLETKLEKLLSGKKDNTLSFDQIGFDYLVVDEAHNYKNCLVITKMNNVSGVQTTSASKSEDMLMKTQYLREKYGDGTCTFATGTPVSNSMVELYSMTRYLRPDLLKEAGLQTFDDWAANFGEVVSQLEIKPAGDGFRMKNRFAKFKNLPELMTMYKEFADIVTIEELIEADKDNKTPTIVIPEIKTGKPIVVKSKPDELQKKYMDILANRAEAIHNGNIDPRIDNMLKITHEARLLGLDGRCLNKDWTPSPDSKVNKLCDNLEAIYNETNEDKGVQIVFCDIAIKEDDEHFSVYNAIREELEKRGIPKDEICFAGDATTDSAKAKMHEQLRTGEKRIILASTSKLGTGANVQNRIAAIHHLDIPWRPADLEQQNGRGIRQGNIFKEVGIYHYVTENTFDAYMLGIITAKAKFISQVMTSKDPARTCEDVDEMVLNYSEMQAIASGNPLIKEKIELENEISRLRTLENEYKRNQYKMQELISERLPSYINRATELLEKVRTDISTYNDNHSPDNFTMTINGTTYTERKEAGEQLEKAIVKAVANNQCGEIGTYAGMKLEIYKNSDYGVPIAKNNDCPCIISLVGELKYEAGIESNNINGNIRRIENLASNTIPDRELQIIADLSSYNENLEAAKNELNTPFNHADDLNKALSRLAEVVFELGTNKTDEVIMNSDDSEDIADTQVTGRDRDELFKVNKVDISDIKQENKEHKLGDSLHIHKKSKAI